MKGRKMEYREKKTRERERLKGKGRAEGSVSFSLWLTRSGNDRREKWSQAQTSYRSGLVQYVSCSTNWISRIRSKREASHSSLSLDSSSSLSSFFFLASLVVVIIIFYQKKKGKEVLVLKEDGIDGKEEELHMSLQPGERTYEADEERTCIGENVKTMNSWFTPKKLSPSLSASPSPSLSASTSFAFWSLFSLD